MKDFSLCKSAYPSAQTRLANQRTKIFLYPPPALPFPTRREGGGGRGMYLYENTNSVDLARRVFHAIFLPLFFFSFFCCFFFFLHSYHFYFFPTIGKFLLVYFFQFLFFSFFYFYGREKCSFYSLWSDGGFERQLNSCVLQSINMHRVIFYFFPGPSKIVVWLCVA